MVVIAVRELPVEPFSMIGKALVRRRVLEKIGQGGMWEMSLAEDTPPVLKGSAAEVIGAGSVAHVDPAKDKVKPYLVLKAGDQRDIAK